MLSLKALCKIRADDILKHFFFPEKIRLFDISYELSALQPIHMNCRVLFYLKKIKK